MPVVAGDIEYRLSGGASNVNPEDALGGAMSTAEIVSATIENLFDNVQASEGVTGDTEYRCFYITNTNATDTLSDVVLWIETQTSSPDTSIEIGLDPVGVGDGTGSGVATTVIDESTAPAGVTFSTPGSASVGLSIGALAAGQGHAVWVKRIVDAAAAVAALDDCRLRIRGVA